MSRSLTSDSLAVQQRDQTRRNLRLVLIAMLFGSGWAALISGAPWIQFTKRMGLEDYPFAWGLLSAIPFIGSFLQLLGSYHVERTGRRKPVFFAGFMTQRFVWLFMAAVPFVLTSYPMLGIFVVLALFFLHHGAHAVSMPSWTSWMADAIPTRIRGRYFGFRAQLGPLVVIPTAVLAGWLLQASERGYVRLPLPGGLWNWPLRTLRFEVSQLELCGAFFAVAAVLGIIDIWMFRGIPDPARPTPPRVGLRQILGPALRNPVFRRFLIFFAAFYIAVPGIGYYVWLYVMNQEFVGAGPLWSQAIFMGGGGLGAILFAGLWGRLLDRFGRKSVYQITYVVPVLLPVLYGLLQPGYWALGFLITFIDGMFWNGVEQTNFNSLLRFSSGNGNGEKNSSAYQAVFALAMAVCGTLSGILFGGLTFLINWIARQGADPAAAELIRKNGWQTDLGGFQFTYIHILFIVATLIRVVVYLTLLPRLHDETRQPVRAAMRYMLASAYGGLLMLIAYPWRALGRIAAGDREADDEQEPDGPAP